MNKRLPLFGIISIIVLALLLPRLWAQRLLYTNSDVRTRVQAALEQTAEQEGLLLSGFTIRSLDEDKMVAVYRAYLRGEDTERCFAIDLDLLSRTSCHAL
jgi:hypothetical protein|tara:strand:- start:107 stop:406 length:300 start_codon:yes stop_codon:yes gene_type:complete